VPVPPRGIHALLRLRTVQIAILAAVVSQGVMTSFMSIAGLILVDHGHDLADVSISLSVHFLGMFGLVLVVGPIVDRVGRQTSILMGLAAIGAGALGFLAGAGLGSVLPAMLAIGIGWNLAFVAATAMLADATAPHERAGLVGFGDLSAMAAASIGSVAAAAILDAGGLVPLVLVGAGLCAIPAVAVLWARTRAAALGAGIGVSRPR
jgi:MFS family permease